jgi:hypothetical protein
MKALRVIVTPFFVPNHVGDANLAAAVSIGALSDANPVL